MISIIMGIYNCADTLIEALDSIAAQTYTDWELIMCDDGSSDNTYYMAAEYVKEHPQYRIKLLKHDKNKENAAVNIPKRKIWFSALSTPMLRV